MRIVESKESSIIEQTQSQQGHTQRYPDQIENWTADVPMYETLEARLQDYCHPPFDGQEGQLNDINDNLMQLNETQIDALGVSHLFKEPNGPHPVNLSAISVFNEPTDALELEMSGVWAVLRHGDRAGLAEIDKTDYASWKCDFTDMQKEITGKVATCLPHSCTKRYDAHYVSEESLIQGVECKSPTLTDSERDVCNPGPHTKSHLSHPSATRGFRAHEVVENAESLTCHSGMLTPVGVTQHRKLGELFRKRYVLSNALSQVTADNVASSTFAMCTDYARTALSAASFLDGLTHVYDTMDNIQTEAEIGSHETHMTVYVLPPERDPALLGKRLDVCSRANAAATAYSRHMREFGHLPTDAVSPIADLTNCTAKERDHTIHLMTMPADQVQSRKSSTKESEQTAEENGAKAFGAVASHLQDASCPALVLETTLLADIVATRQCHGMKLPCQTQVDTTIPGIDKNLICMDNQTALDLMHQADRDYARRYSGESNRLLMYPLLRQIASQMEHVSIADASGKKDDTIKRIWVRFAHDVTVYPIGSALGIGDYQWPGYASRVTWELWKSNDATQFFVRVLYQGKDRTHRLSCARRVYIKQPTDVSQIIGIILCPLTDYINTTLQNLLPDPTITWQQACNLE